MQSPWIVNCLESFDISLLCPAVPTTQLAIGHVEHLGLYKSMLLRTALEGVTMQQRRSLI